MGIISERNLRSFKLGMVLLLAGMIIATTGLAGHAAAERGDDKKGHDSGKGKEEKKSHQESEHQDSETVDKGKQQERPQTPDKGGAPDLPKNTRQSAYDNPPQSSPPPQQNNSPPPAVQPEQQAGAQTPAQAPVQEQKALSDPVMVQDTPYASATTAGQAGDTISIKESAAIKSAAHLARDVSDSVVAGESIVHNAAKNGVTVLTGSELRVSDNIAISGTTVPPMVPKISVTSPPLLQVSDGQDAEITFHSTSAGTFSIAVRGPDGNVAQTIKGEMKLGSNSAAWDGTGRDGKAATNGQYAYFISAAGPGGTREPPAQGDGAIAVALKPAAKIQNANLLLIAPIAGAAVAILLLLRRKSKSLIIYLPAEAAAAVDDLRSRHPGARVDEYVEVAGDGRVQRYRGVTIRQDGMDEGWVQEEAEKAKGAAELDSIAVNYGGKLQIL